MWLYLNAVDLDTVGTLSWRDAVLHLHCRQEVPPERSITRLEHLHILAIGSKGHLEEIYICVKLLNKKASDKALFSIINHLQLQLLK